MNCRRVSSLISAYIDGELTGVEMLEIRRHLDGCRACMLQYESLRYTKQLLSCLKYVEPRPGLTSELCARLDDIEIPGYQRVWHRITGYGHLHMRVTPIAASCTAVGALLLLLLSHSVKQPDVVAYHQPPLLAGSLGLPAGAIAAVPVNYTNPNTENSYSAGSSRIPSYVGRSEIIVPASFEGP